VNDDGYLSPLDVLAVINKLNGSGTGGMASGEQDVWRTYMQASEAYPFNYLSPLDVLRGINETNSRRTSVLQQTNAEEVRQTSLDERRFDAGSLSKSSKAISLPGDVSGGEGESVQAFGKFLLDFMHEAEHDEALLALFSENGPIAFPSS